MKITEKNFPKVSAKMHRLRQHWRRRVKISHVVQYVATVAFFALSLMWACHMLPVLLAEELAQKNLGFIRHIANAWDFVLDIFKVPEDPVARVFAGVPCMFVLSFLVAAVAAVVASVRYKPEPKPKDQLKHSVLSGMITGIKIYQERIGLLENYAVVWSNILSPVFAVCMMGLVAYLFGINSMFKDHMEGFIGVVIFVTIGSCIGHRLLSFLLSLPVALLYCFGMPAPGLRKALEAKKEELKPVYKYANQPKTYVSKETTPAAWGTEDYLRIQRKAEASLHGSDVWVPSREDLLDPPLVHVDVSDM